jgi:probable rRNA maturation factor
MFIWEIVSESQISYEKKVIDKIFEVIWKIVPIPQKWTLNIVFVDDYSIQNLNKNYRKKDSITDVLSFHYFTDFSKLKKSDIAWELVFCEEKIISQWKEYGLWTEGEFYKLLIHSVLHIIWFDHEEDKDFAEMQLLEKKIWTEVFWNKWKKKKDNS